MCDERERLIGFVYDECDADERREIARHLEECGTCRTEIAGLRDARQDLLAWEVQGEPAVWRPMAAPVIVPWWKQVPVWAMAAAASVMFVIGAAGGLLTHALMGDRAAAVSTDARSGPVVTPVTARATDDQALHQRIIDVLRAELAQQATANSTRGASVRTAAAAVDPDQLLQRLTTMMGESERRQTDLIVGLNNAIDYVTKDNASLRREVGYLTQRVAQDGGGGK